MISARSEPVRGLWVIWVIWVITFQSLAVDVRTNPTVHLYSVLETFLDLRTDDPNDPKATFSFERVMGHHAEKP